MNKEIGKILKSYRANIPVSLKYLSYVTKIPYQKLWRYEKGITGVPIESLLKILEIYIISPTMFFNRLTKELKK